jgi:hypothetical protein
VKEINLRKWHRSTGIVLALFIILQAGTGLIFSLGDLIGPDTDEDSGSATNPGSNHETASGLEDSLKLIHFGGETVGGVYRILLGIGIVYMAVSGSIIYFKIRSRSKQHPSR